MTKKSVPAEPIGGAPPHSAPQPSTVALEPVRPPVEQLPLLQLTVAPENFPARREELPCAQPDKIHEDRPRGEIPALMTTSLTTRVQARDQARDVEIGDFRRARDRYAAAWYSSEASAEYAKFLETCVSIAQARAARGEPHPDFPALLEARRIANTAGTPIVHYATERVLVEAAADEGRQDDAAWHLHQCIWTMKHGGQGPGDLDPAGAFKQRVWILVNDLAEAAIADLRSSGAGLRVKVAQRPIVYVEHFADEVFEPGDLIEQTHTFAD